MSASPFELEVLRAAAREGIPAPEVVVSARVSGTAATAASGRRIRLDSRVLEWPGPAQRWIAAHEVYHAVAHGWREPGRWLTLLAAALAVGVGGWSAWLGGPGTALITLIGAGLLMLAGTSWWTRRLEEQADRYAASDGRLDALDEDSLLELFLGEAIVPHWLSTHPAGLPASRSNRTGYQALSGSCRPVWTSPTPT